MLFPDKSSNIKKLILGVDYDLIISSGKNFKEKGINFFNREYIWIFVNIKI